MGLMAKMFGIGSDRTSEEQMEQRKRKVAGKTNDMRKEYDDKIKSDPNINRAYLLHSLEQKYGEPQQRERQERVRPMQSMPVMHQHQPRENQPPRKKKSGGFLSGLGELGANLNQNMETGNAGLFNVGGREFQFVNPFDPSYGRPEKRYRKKSRRRQR